MHAQELLLRPQAEVLLVADCGLLELEFWKLQELLCGCVIKAQELLCGSLQGHFERNKTGCV